MTVASMPYEVRGRDPGSTSFNQRNPYGARLKKYGCSPTGGKCAPPNISTTADPRQLRRSSATGSADGARLATTSTRSSASSRTYASTRVLVGERKRSEPRPNARVVFRVVTILRIDVSIDDGERSWASTLTLA